MINGALTVVLVFCALMLGGLVGGWAIWPTAYRHGYGEGESERHRHRLGDPQETTLLQLPRAGRIPLDRLADPTPLPGEPPWLFAGESEQGWAAEAAEYELLHQPEPEHVPGVDTPSDFTRRMALDMDLFIKNMVEQSNYDQHMMRAD